MMRETAWIVLPIPWAFVSKSCCRGERTIYHFITEKTTLVLRLLLLDHPVNAFQLELLETARDVGRLSDGNRLDDGLLLEGIPHRLDRGVSFLQLQTLLVLATHRAMLSDVCVDLRGDSLGRFGRGIDCAERVDED